MSSSKALVVLAALLVCMGASQGRRLQSNPASAVFQAVPQADSAAARHADVLIIGAGMAGITAAKNLTASGAKVIILEARDRSGGRLLSTPTVANGKVDLGAMWIHDGFPGNPLYDLATALNEPLSREQDYFSFARFTPDGALGATTNASREVGEAFLNDVLMQISLLRGDPSAVDVPIATLFDKMLAAHPQWTPEQIRLANLNMHTNFQVLLNANITELSALRYGDAKTLPAIDVLLKNGYDSLVDVQKPGLDIRYNSPVMAVAQDSQGVTLTTADGRTFTAPYAITTQSLGVLKEGKVQFTPALPADKARAIADMGMGVLDKTIVVFDEPFWSDNDFISREMVDWSGLWAEFLNVNRSLGLPILVALNAEGTARQLETMTDDEVVASLMAVLRKMYGPSVPQPKQHFVTRWAEDLWARGSYSYFATGNPLNITGELARPVGRLLFAGEATSDKPATVLGAYLSGQREGARAAQLLGLSVAVEATAPAVEPAVASQASPAG